MRHSLLILGLKMIKLGYFKTPPGASGHIFSILLKRLRLVEWWPLRASIYLLSRKIKLDTPTFKAIVQVYFILCF